MRKPNRSVLGAILASMAFTVALLLAPPLQASAEADGSCCKIQPTQYGCPGNQQCIAIGECHPTEGKECDHQCGTWECECVWVEESDCNEN